MAIIAARAPVRKSSQTKSIFQVAHFSPVVIVAITDSSVPWAYFFQILQVSSLDLWYAITLSVKIIICLFSLNTISLGRLSAFSLYGVIAIILLSCAAGGSEPNSYIRSFAFVANLFLTLSIVKRNNLSLYVTTCVWVLGVSTVLYVAEVHAGVAKEVWGRFSYFGGTEPNLGSEIVAMSVVLATCVLPPVRLLLFAAPSLYAINLMQGRSALIVALVALAAKLFFGIESTQKRLIAALMIAFVGLVLFIFFFADVNAFFNAMFLVDDEYRGSSTGFTGRDQLWGAAWKYFEQSPFIGNGVGFGEKVGVEPHNFFLYGLSQFGLLSFFIFGTILFLYFDLYRSNRQWVYGLLAIPIFWMFNDRFFNLNPYPFLFYVVLFAHADVSSRIPKPPAAPRFASPRSRRIRSAR